MRPTLTPGYVWHKGGLYARSESGNTLLPPHEGRYTWLEDAAEDEADAAAALWAAQGEPEDDEE